MAVRTMRKVGLSGQPGFYECERLVGFILWAQCYVLVSRFGWPLKNRANHLRVNHLSYNLHSPKDK